MKDLKVELEEDQPGTLADIGETLGNAGVNIDGICGFLCEGKGVIHILVEDAASANKALKEGGFEVTEECDVLVLDVLDLGVTVVAQQFGLMVLIGCIVQKLPDGAKEPNVVGAPHFGQVFDQIPEQLQLAIAVECVSVVEVLLLFSTFPKPG